MPQRAYAFFLIITIIIAAACSNSSSTSLAKKDTTLYYPYVPEYSSLEAGNPLYAEKVLKVWRQYETGNILTMLKEFSDSITLFFPDAMFKGKRDSVLELWQKRRKSYSDMQSHVETWLPVKAKEKNEDLVLIWGRQDCTRKGANEYFVLHEVWRFDLNGKIKGMSQYITYPY